MQKHFDETDSTNRWLRDHIADCTHGFLVDADFQTAGKGQATNKWESERGQNLLFSLLLEPTKIALREQFLLSELVSLAMVDTLKRHLGCDVRIKWPNDIYVGDSKLCGILIETIVQGGAMAKAIVGIGLNVNQTVFTSDAPNPVSMKNITGKNFEKELILSDLHNAILNYYANFAPAAAAQVQQRYFAALYRNAGLHTYQLPDGTRFAAAIERVEPTGHLVLRDADNHLRTFAFKEVQFVIAE